MTPPEHLPRLLDSDPHRRWLFAMTHPDDEITICCWIRHLVQAGAEVWLSWTHDLPVRNSEAHRFAEMVGVPKDRLFFHGGSDGRVVDELETLYPRFATMMERVRPDVVACGAFEQGHLDHDSTNLLVNATYAGVVGEIPFYHSYLTRLQRINRFVGEGGPEETYALDLEGRHFKKAVARNYPSQNIYRLILFHEARETLFGRKPMLGRRELIRAQSHRDFLIPNHPQPRRGKIERCAKWRRWQTRVAPFLATHPIPPRTETSTSI